MPKPPAVREGEDHIEIDAKKGEWPFIQAARLDDGSLGVVIDCNPGGHVVGEGAGVAALRISAKKAKRLREFLERTEL